ncbi:MAG: hypothetical protein K6B43_09125 [Treponema sp.]|nr:hypothetical protein [Treponema sp.]
MRKKFFSGLLLAAMSISGCSTMNSDNCPYLIANQKFEIGSSSDGYEFAGTRFTFHNGSKKDVKSFTVSFMLYDSDGNNPFIGSNNVVERIDEQVLSGMSKSILLSMDDYLSSVPSEPYQIDYMYVRKIIYSDGSEWTDPFGMYSAREAFE